MNQSVDGILPLISTRPGISPPVIALCNQKNVLPLGPVTKDRIKRIKFLQLNNQMPRSTGKLNSRYETIPLLLLEGI